MRTLIECRAAVAARIPLLGSAGGVLRGDYVSPTFPTHEWTTTCERALVCACRAFASWADSRAPPARIL
jgi:hypothetical protein